MILRNATAVRDVQCALGKLSLAALERQPWVSRLPLNCSVTHTHAAPLLDQQPSSLQSVWVGKLSSQLGKMINTSDLVTSLLLSILLVSLPISSIAISNTSIPTRMNSRVQLGYNWYKKLTSFVWIFSSDRSSYTDDGPRYIRGTSFFRFSLSPLVQLMLQVSL